MTTARSRKIVGVATGLVWGATIYAAMAELPLRVFLLLCLATLLVSLIALGAWLTRADHGALAVARTKIELVRLHGALVEEAEARAEQNHPERRVRSVA